MMIHNKQVEIVLSDAGKSPCMLNVYTKEDAGKEDSPSGGIK